MFAKFEFVALCHDQTLPPFASRRGLIKIAPKHGNINVFGNSLDEPIGFGERRAALGEKARTVLRERR